MSVVVHDWILDKVYPAKTTYSFKPNGEHLSSGLPIGWIKSETTKVVEASRVSTYAGSTFGAPGGGATINADGSLTISVAGGSTTTIQCLSQGENDVQPPDGDSTFPPTSSGNAGWAFDEECEGIADMILGLYRFRGTWTSTVYSYSLGAWGGEE